jgi:urea transporter
MKVFGISVLPELEPSAMPFWRQALRGFSQCAFQAHELCALLLIAAATQFNPRMGAFYVVSVVVATVVARLLRGNSELLGLGLYGFNSGLMGLALGNFFAPNPMLWVWMIVLAGAVAAVSVVLARWLPFPFLAAPFIATFWVIWPLAEHVGLVKIELGAFPDAPVTFIAATVAALGAALFASATWSGILFFTAVLVSNWRHAVVALIGAALASSLAAHVGAAGSAINSGFIGFNAVLAAIATYALIAEDLRLTALAALVATWIFSYVGRHMPAPALASGFVLTVWAILLVGRLNPRFSGARLPSVAELLSAPQAEAATS